jgi:hypothetical protein
MNYPIEKIKFCAIAFVLVLVISISVSSVFGLQQVAGTLTIPTPIGGSNSTNYGLVNDGKENILVTLRAEGDVANYLSFEKTVTLEPNKINYVKIAASVPKDYDISKGSNITGYVYALQEGQPGQVQLNVQMKKNVVIPVYESTQPIVSPFSFTGSFVSATQFTYPIIGLFVVVVIMLLYIFKFKREVKKE